MSHTLDVIVYDIEIERCIPDQRKPREPDLQYCDGWHDHANMGIAVLAAYDSRNGTPRIFLEDNLPEFAALIEGRVVAGFNNHSFDDRLLMANGIMVGASYDLCVEFRAACSEPRAYTPGKTRGGRTLDAIAAANLGRQKTLSGALAPVEWQRKQYGKVIDYCMGDVVLTHALLQALPTLVDPVSRQPVTLAMPSEVFASA